MYTFLICSSISAAQLQYRLSLKLYLLSCTKLPFEAELSILIPSSIAEYTLIFQIAPPLPLSFNSIYPNHFCSKQKLKFCSISLAKYAKSLKLNEHDAVFTSKKSKKSPALLHQIIFIRSIGINISTWTEGTEVWVLQDSCKDNNWNGKPHQTILRYKYLQVVRRLFMFACLVKRGS